MRQRRTGRGGGATMEDVAQVAGVSAMTVSRVLRQPELVNKDLRAKVEAAIRETGYIYNLVASSLASQRSGTIALILPTVASSIFSDSVKGVSDVCRERSVQMIMAETNYVPAEEERVIEALLRRRPDGFVIVGVSHTRATRDMLEKSGVPVVETWDATATPIDSLVSLSNFDAMQAMTQALVAEGYRRIAFVGTATRDHRALMRARGYEAGMAAAGLPIPDILAAGDVTSMGSGAAIAEEIMARGDRPEAVVFLNDVLAAGALLAFQRKGLRVPEDIAVAGFGGFDFARHLIPSLTTVDIPRQEIGRRAAQILLDRIEGKAPAGTLHAVGFEVALRESTRRVPR
ncbi:LacI family DNA-binding transcriptional regulator [Xanthobacter dioxanivorans]|uniref:LacI family DNA-binding transcriptional regulator n=1 Tax=Xanthobacter dioxanivorans TaxID=2528964 RepID=A0A974PS97_9HYPH|nr:LacI family DNA-binding transcriptional regulator [Xanthobacter dioxanivorans]QRG08862.1 LacI family DNA-binding transcriptional regulator [Xanthobacter dioxanivorans]